MKKLLTTTFLAFILLQTKVASCQVNKIITQLHSPNDKHVLVTAHRGDWRNAPENSLRCYELAIAMGVDCIEIDLNKTKDGVIVVMHDGTIDRTTDGKGKPSDYTLAELKKFHLRNGLGVITKHTIPTLEEVMHLAKGRVIVNLDKSFPYYKEAYDVLKKTGTLDQAIFKTDLPYQQVVAAYGHLIDSITFMPVVYLDKPTAKEIIDEYQNKVKPVAFELIFQEDTSRILTNHAFINEHGAKIWVNALWPSLNGGHSDDMAFDKGDTKDSWDWIINHGATIIQTDRPKELLKYLRDKSLHR